MIVCAEIQILDLAVTERINEPAQFTKDGTFVLDFPAIADDLEQSNDPLHYLDLVDVDVTSCRLGCVEIIPSVGGIFVVGVLGSELENETEQLVIIRRSRQNHRF